jgi:hypothetical protein
MYGAKTQYATTDETPPLSATQCLTIQKVTGSILYYARAVDPTVLMPPNDIATEQTKATEKNTGHHKSIIGFSGNAPGRHHQISCLRHDFAHPQRRLKPFGLKRTKPAGRSVFLRQQTPEQDQLNGSILNVASVIKNMVASAAESEVGACFHNAQSGAPLRVTLTELGHIQPPTPLRTDNSTAFGILNETIKQKRSKAMDMQYHWLTDRFRQKQFDVY